MTFSEKIDPRMFVVIELAHTLTLGVLQRFFKLVRKARGKDVWKKEGNETLNQVSILSFYEYALTVKINLKRYLLSIQSQTRARCITEVQRRMDSFEFPDYFRGSRPHDFEQMKSADWHHHESILVFTFYMAEFVFRE